MTKVEKPFRVRPRKPRARQSSDRALWASAYLLLSGAMRLVRGARRRAARSRAHSAAEARTHLQRVAVRITYCRNKCAGQWRAHGRYIARESAARSRQAGFDQTDDCIDIARKLDEWQQANDKRLWKIILSPEFGDRVDLKRLTRQLLERMEVDLETRLEWVGVTHSNTEYKHVHVALRGRRDDGEALLMARDYIKYSIRRHAEELCTQQLGYRTRLDMEEAQRRELTQARFTSLDRIIARGISHDRESGHFVISQPESKALSDRLLIWRLQNLTAMGLAVQAGPISWKVRADFEEVLRSMQKAADRQHTLLNHGLPVSDKRLPFRVLDHLSMKSVEGRILVHGEDEVSGRHYLILEGVDANLHFVPYTGEMEDARSWGRLRPGSFVVLRKRFENGNPRLNVDDLGDAEALLKNEKYLQNAAKRPLRSGVLEQAQSEGWLGRYESALWKEKQRQDEKNTERDR